MLLSMTGFGDARRQSDRLSIAVEVRSVNNRYLKVSTRCPDCFAPLEGRIEKAVRNSITRGTVSVVVRADRMAPGAQYQLDRDVLESYWRQLAESAAALGTSVPADPAALLPLPGVVVEHDGDSDAVDEDWPLIHETLTDALVRLQEFRAAEGAPMQRDLVAQCSVVATELQQIIGLAPRVVHDFRDRLLDRVRELLDGLDAEADSADLIREVSIFSERCDINEEITRLRSHLDQFRAFLDQDESQGRKLEFLSQEMFREINTIGSKANNVEIAHAVVEMKSAVEKMREILQNVE